MRDFFLQLYALFYILFGCSVNRMNVPKILLWSLFVRLFTLKYCGYGTRDMTPIYITDSMDQNEKKAKMVGKIEKKG